MTELAWHAPPTDMLTMISPSAINTYERCPRKLAYQRDPTTRGLSRPSLRTALGVVAHALHETAATKRPAPGQDRRAWLEEQWERHLDEQAAKVAYAWAGREVPPVDQWDGVVATRVRTVRKLAARPDPASSTAQPLEGAGFPWIERALKDPDAGLVGTPDRVEIHEGKLRVVDLKSGVHQAEVEDSQRRQLLLYAHLVDVACNQLPVTGVIETARGSETTFAIESVAVTDAVQVAQQTVAAYNSSLAAGDLPANAGETSCRNCAFRTVCSAYWASDAKSDRDVRGRVVHADSRSFTLDTGDSGSLRVVLAQGCATPVTGDEVAVLDLLPAGPETMKMRWNSSIRLPDANP